MTPITELSIRSNPNYLERVRRVIGCLTEHAGMDQKEAYDTKLAVTEACANAIRHGSPDHGSDRITIRLSSETGKFVAEVSDRGKGFDHTTLRRPEPAQVGGHGIQLMEALADEVEFIHGSVGTTVRLTKVARRPRRPRTRNKLR